MENTGSNSLTMSADESISLPTGRYIELPGRGKMFYRQCAEQKGKPTLLLLHGMLASSGLNWFQTFEPLAEHFNVIAVDLRGHGRSMRKQKKRFTLQRCTDDLAAFIDAQKLKDVIVVGYSMGGAIAQLLCHQHPDKVSGLVLSGTGFGYRVGLRERFIIAPLFASLVGATRLTELFSHLPNRMVAKMFPGVKVDEFMSIRHWVADELRRNKVRVIVESASEMANHNSKKWLNKITLPTAVLVTLQDAAFSAQHQIEMALRIPGAEILRYDGGHNACASADYGPALTEACLNVSQRL
jgi:3-oxoadipate enol-lactonase